MVNITFFDVKDETNTKFWEMNLLNATMLYFMSLVNSSFLQFFLIGYLSTRFLRSTKDPFFIFLFYIGYIFVTSNVNGIIRLMAALYSHTILDFDHLEGPYQRELGVIDMWLHLFLHLICLILSVYLIFPHNFTFRVVNYSCMAAFISSFVTTAYFDSFPCFHQYISASRVDSCTPIELFGLNPPVYVTKRIEYLRLRLALTATSFIALIFTAICVKNVRKIIFKFIKALTLFCQLPIFLEVLVNSSKRTVYGEIYHVVIQRYIHALEAFAFTGISFLLLFLATDLEMEFQENYRQMAASQKQSSDSKKMMIG